MRRKQIIIYHYNSSLAIPKMKVSHLIITIGCLFGAYLVYKYLRSRKRSYYTTPGGQWVLKWNVPTGTPPFSYLYKITDETGKTVVNSTTSDTSLILDPTLFVPSVSPGSLMSDKRYTAVVTPTNSVGSGDSDTITFQIYDTPSINTLIDAIDPTVPIYPVSGGSTIFEPYNQICSTMQLGLNDRVAPDNLKIFATCNGKTYNPVNVIATNANANQEASQYTITWTTCPSGWTCNPPPVSFNTGDQVTINISTSNPAGTFSWDNTYTVGPPPAIPPGDVQASAVFVSS